MKYLSKSQSGQSYSVTGDLGTYSGGGLVVDIPNTQTKVQIQATLAALQTAGFVSMATRAMILEWTMYNPSLQQFSYCRVVCSYLTSVVVRVLPLRLHQSGAHLCEVVQV